MADGGEIKSQEEDLPPDIKDWSKHQVKAWTLTLDDVDDGVAEILFEQDINGPMSERMDPLVETFSTFWQELRGDTEQILCICDNEKGFTSWKDLIDARCGINISGRCIYDLSFAEVNGTILSLLSKNRRSSRFLPCGGGSKVSFEKKVERSLSSLEVLCVNQCDGGSKDQIVIEENFYKGGKVSWWNFYFSEQPASTPFIKRDKFDFIMDTVIPDLCSLRNACVVFNLVHVPGCGGTTLAMHTLWALRDKFRCAVLRDSNADFAEVADQVVNLLMYKHEKKSPSIPVLLMIEDFDDKEKVFDLQQLIEKECAKKRFSQSLHRTDSADLLKNQGMLNLLKLHEARQYLEMQKADSYSGILSYLSNQSSPEKMEKIARQYAFLFEHAHKPTVRERINFIYVNVVLSCIKLKSRYILPYQKLLELLDQVMREQIPLSETLSLYFIAVVLLWPQQCNWKNVPAISLGKCISQMKTSYHTEMKEVYNGKWPVVHFFLGRKQGYEQLVHQGEITKSGQEEFAVKNGKIWKEEEVEARLCRVTGEVKNNLILADTCIPNLKIEVTPRFRSQLCAHTEGSKVSFFTGFSMGGPVALDISYM
ncbi:Sterile alpha motif domain containing protein 9-like [Dissostichus eleginoides]|uniref:Sterile alpha motif domain containing protein 9-like n=1 Tax=Dissostichus eleginoides TaxID=100907 RepID=A0AAD9BIK3_DISEL|nr:Sterile alpha motif domain containing protein 9-like [Dissostichus eleginoides]